MKRFWRGDQGYVLVLVLLALPVLMLMAVLVIDIARGNNAQSDLAAAADALALAAAAELDGKPDALTRAQTAMAALANTVDFLTAGSGPARQTITPEPGGAVQAVFLRAIPASDDLPIDAAWIAAQGTQSGVAARYVMITVEPPSGFQPLFPNPLGGARSAMPLRARAVARPETLACGMTPLFICNPFEAASETLEDAFAAGHLHARLLRLAPLDGTQRPGNFGFLVTAKAPDMSTASIKALADMIAGAPTEACFAGSRVATLPEAANIADAHDTIFDVYDGRYRNTQAVYPPGINVRKGWIPINRRNPDYCRMAPADPANGQALGFPDNSAMVALPSGAPGALIGQGGWALPQYWLVNFQAVLTAAQRAAMSSFAVLGPDGMILPARYDTYRYEIDNGLVGHWSQGGPVPGENRESGQALCAISRGVTPVADPDRRVALAAVIDCLANPDTGQPRPIRGFVSMFMPTPMDAAPEKRSKLDVEIIDVTGAEAGIQRGARLVR